MHFEKHSGCLLATGLTSEGQLLFADLQTEGHLFFSWSRPEQVTHLFKYWLSELHQQPTVLIAYSAHRTLAGLFEQYSFTLLDRFVRFQDTTDLQGSSPDLFFEHLYRQLKLRQKQKSSDSNNTIQPVYIFIDDLSLLLVFKKKKTGRYVLELLANGAACGLHFITGSTGSFRHLILQLQHAAEKLLAKDLKGFYRTGAELVLTDDGLHFYRSKTDMDYTRLYPFSQID